MVLTMPFFKRLRAPRSISGRLLLLIAFAAICAGFPMRAHAHPDVRLQYYVRFSFVDHALTTIGESWTFDANFTTEMMSDFDLDHDGKLSPKEIKAMGTEVLSNLKEYQYFTFAKLNGAPLKTANPANFQARVSKGFLSIAFDLPVPAKPAMSGKELRLQIHDPQFSVMASAAPRTPVRMSGVFPETCQVAVHGSAREAYVTGGKEPQEVILRCP